MAEQVEKKAGWKEKALREIVEYWSAFSYLALFFGSFTWYRRLILAQYEISYFHYGSAVVEALVLAKVILVGDALKLGRRLEDRPLIYSTLNKAVIFTLWVGVFSVVEFAVEGWIDGKGLDQILNAMRSENVDELLAKCLVTFVSFIPFFAFRELERVLGEGTLKSLFLHPRPNGRERG